MAMTRLPLGITDAIADRSKLLFADRTPSESRWCTGDEQQTDEQNGKTMERQFEAGGRGDGVGTNGSMEGSTDAIEESDGNRLDNLPISV
jgi:hypothetical protein